MASLSSEGVAERKLAQPVGVGIAGGLGCLHLVFPGFSNPEGASYECRPIALWEKVERAFGPWWWNIKPSGWIMGAVGKDKPFWTAQYLARRGRNTTPVKLLTVWI